MLSNLTLVGCYDHTTIPDSAERDRILLNSAMENLRQMAYFGLTERQADTQFLFERTFGIQFRRRFVQFNNTHANKADVTDSEIRAVQKLNRLMLSCINSPADCSMNVFGGQELCTGSTLQSAGT